MIWEKDELDLVRSVRYKRYTVIASDRPQLRYNLKWFNANWLIWIGGLELTDHKTEFRLERVGLSLCVAYGPQHDFIPLPATAFQCKAVEHCSGRQSVQNTRLVSCVFCD